MKIMHLSDLHIGLKLFEQSLLDDQAFIFHQIAEIAGEEQPDAILVAGDIYNQAVPSAESVALFDAFLNELRGKAPSASIMLISGNHDSADRINAFRQVLSEERVFMIGQPPRQPEEYIERVTLTDEWGPVNFYLLPYVKPAMIRNITGTRADGSSFSYDEALHLLLERETINPSERNVLVSHQFYLPVGVEAENVERMDSEVLRVGNIDMVRADFLQRFDYAALGHIHKPMRVGGETARYCGTPLACSVSEAGQEKAVLIVELGSKPDTQNLEALESVMRNLETPHSMLQQAGSGTVQIRRRVLSPLRQVCRLRGTLEEVLTHAGDDYVYVELTDQIDLDAADMNARLYDAFPHLLKVSRVNARTADYSMEGTASSELIDTPFELCRRFLRLEEVQQAEEERTEGEKDKGSAAEDAGGNTAAVNGHDIEYLELLQDIINAVLDR